MTQAPRWAANGARRDRTDRLRLAYLFISHDLSAVAHIADRIAVIYAGVLLEEGPTAEMLTPPFHPYTEALLSAVPSVEPASRRERIRLHHDASEAGGAASGCPFHRRCPRKIGSICEEEDPPILRPTREHWIRCHLPLEQLRTCAPVRSVRDELSAPLFS